MPECSRPLTATKTPEKMILRPYGHENKTELLLPCGNCINCRMNYARQWAQRCEMESKTNNGNNWFLTMTYNDKQLNWNTRINQQTGELDEVATLRKKDTQDFMKRLRQHYKPQKIRFMLAGEYGDQTARPHYHAIIFNLEITDLKPIKNTRYFESKTIEKIWKKGQITLAKYTFETANYTAGYILKKQKGKSKTYEKNNIEPPFLTSSRKPGIGAKYFTEHWKKIYKNDEIFAKTEKGIIKLKPSKYFDKLLEKTDPELYEKTKTKREFLAKQKTLPETTKNPFEYDIVISDESEKKHSLKGQRKI